MNDKPSKRPPSPYTRQDEAMEDYMTAPSTSQASAVRSSQDMGTTYDAGIEQEKSSTMYRFGKAIASVFNPVSAWTGRWKSKESQADPQQAVLHERQAKAQKAYAELKKTGFKGLGSSVGPLEPGVTATTQLDVVPSTSQATSFRDLAVDTDEQRLLVGREDNQASESGTDVMPAPSVPLAQRTISPMPAASRRRSSLNLHTPSFSTLKRVGSHIQLPSTKRHSAQENIRTSTDSINSGIDGEQIKKQSSKKDLLRQQKLYKKVSNLESKLEAARRELEAVQGFAYDTTSDQTAVRPKPFTPGALPSLPSERMLQAQVNGNNINNNQADILSPSEELPGLNTQSRYSADRQSNNRNLPVLFPNLPLAPKPKNTPRIEDILNHDTQTNNASSEPQLQGENAVKKPRRNRQTDENTPVPGSLPRAQSEREGSHKKPLRKGQAATVPPVPQLPPPFQPSQVDKAKIMLMREPVDYPLPFGQSAMDPINLRKVYPLITDPQIEELTGKPLLENRNVDVTSTTHLNHAPAPTLSPPRSPSPVPADSSFKPSISKSSLRSRTQKVPHNSPVSVRKTAQAEFEEITRQAAGHETATEEEKDVVGPLNEAAMKGLPPYPKNPGVTVQNLGKQGEARMGPEKPLPGIQKEDFQWDEDVF